jgi:hypothetical protein
MRRLAAALAVCLLLVACTAAGYRPPPGADLEPVHGQSDGSGGGAM